MGKTCHFESAQKCDVRLDNNNFTIDTNVREIFHDDTAHIF